MSRIRLLFDAESVAVADRISAALAVCGYVAGTETGPASAALVIWSPKAGRDPAILAAARAALARRVLIPTALGKSPPPASFEHLWPMDLSGWDGSAGDPRWQFVLDEIDLAIRRGVEFGGIVEIAPQPQPPTLQDAPAYADTLQGVYTDERYSASPTPRPRLPFAAMLAGFVLLGVAAGGAFLFGREASRTIPASASLPVIAYLEPDERLVGEGDVPYADYADAYAAPASSQSAPEEPPIEAAASLAPVPSAENSLPEETRLREPAPATPISLASAEAPVPNSPPEETTPPASVESDTKIASENDDAIASLTQEAVISVEPEPASADVGLFFRDCVDCPDMAEVSTQFGAPSSYAIGVREVTNAQWKFCAEEKVCPSAPAGSASAPVLQVSYADALRYVSWISAKTGRAYRLPSEMEWNFAAGAEPAADQNPFGVEGLAGGVWEWTMACAGAAENAGDPCDRRFIRGGDSGVSSGGASAAKDAAAIDERRTNVGFRVARDLP